MFGCVCVSVWLYLYGQQQQHPRAAYALQVQQQYLRVVERAEKEEREVQDLIQMREQAYMELLEGRSDQPAQDSMKTLPNIRTSTNT